MSAKNLLALPHAGLLARGLQAPAAKAGLLQLLQMASNVVGPALQPCQKVC